MRLNEARTKKLGRENEIERITDGHSPGDLAIPSFFTEILDHHVSAKAESCAAHL